MTRLVVHARGQGAIELPPTAKNQANARAAIGAGGGDQASMFVFEGFGQSRHYLRAEEIVGVEIVNGDQEEVPADG